MRTRVLSLSICFLILFLAPPFAEAGIWDSIKGFFGKASDTVKGWFSGGGEKEFQEMLQEMVASQEVVNEKQNAVYDILTRSNPNPKDPEYQKSMNELSEASRSNEELYTKLLQVRQELAEKDRDLSKYDEHLKRIQETQHNLEEGYQAIQKKSRQIGAYKPPQQVASEKRTLEEAPWANPEARKYIDEWLAANGLNEYGVLTGGVVVKSVSPDFEGTRHQFVWNELAKQRGRITGTTLEQYVKQRMNGSAAANPAGGMETASATSGGASGGELERGSTTSAVASSSSVSGGVSSGASLANTEEQLKGAMESYQNLAAKGKGDSSEAKELLETIKVLKAQRDEMISSKSAAQGQ